MNYVTFLNAGCVEICRNMLASAARAGMNLDDFSIACLDRRAYDMMKEFKGAYLYDDQLLTEYQHWSPESGSGFRKIGSYKWAIIGKTHATHLELCWVDADIVFKSNPVDLIAGREKMLFQSDSPGSVICAGFMVFNPGPESRRVVQECARNGDGGEDDQSLVNRIVLDRYPDSYRLLPVDLFPNGHEYYSNGRKENAVIVHNNWMVGMDIKIERFKQEGLWFL